MPKKIRDLLEEFIINAQLVMPALGHKVFEPQPSRDTDTNIGDDQELLYLIVATEKVDELQGK